MTWNKLADILTKAGTALFIAGVIVGMCGLDAVHTIGGITLLTLSVVCLIGSIAASKEALNEILEDEEIEKEERL